MSLARSDSPILGSALALGVGACASDERGEGLFGEGDGLGDSGSDVEGSGATSNGATSGVCEGDLTQALQGALELITFSCDTLPPPAG